MSVFETVAVFVGVPALIVLVVGGLAYALSSRGGGKRYRPGRPYQVAPVWFLAAPDAFDEAARRRELTGHGSAPGLPAGGRVAAGRHAAPQGSTGGASDRW